jgi:hypothetical protein
LANLSYLFRAKFAEIVLETNFVELRACELLRIPQPVEKVGAELKVSTNRAPEAPKSPKYGVFEARSGVEALIVGVFQQADPFYVVG